MTSLPVHPIHVFPYCHKVSGGHSNAIRAFIQCEREMGLDSRMICPDCDPQPLEETITAQGILTRKIDKEESPVLLPVDSKSLVFHLHGIVPNSTRCRKILGRLSIPYVFTSHGTLYCRDALHFLKKFTYLNFVDPIITYADGVHFLTNKMLRQFPYVMPFWQGETVVAPNTVAPPEAEQVIAASRNQFGIPEDALLFLYLGRIDVHTKGLDLLVRALARLPENARAWLVFVGPNWKDGQETLTRLAGQLRCADRISFLAPQYGDDKWRALKMADVFVSPSRWEAFSISLVEAMSVGLPTITSTEVNIAHDLHQARAALLSDLSAEALADAMKQMIGPPQRRNELGDRGRAWVSQNCSTQTVGKHLADFYERVLRRRFK